MKQETGYTLIELIVVITVLGMLLGITLPRVRDALVFDQSRKVSLQLLSLIGALKRAAVSDQKRYVLHIDLTDNRFWSAEEAAGDVTDEASEPVGISLPAGLWFSRVVYPHDSARSSGVAEIRFYPKGYSDAAEIHLDAPSRDRRIVVVEPFLPEARLRDAG